ncbi:hypothetical protein [Spiroplasma floricola]|uniref:Uncharacterized protein n=1 Tax=Spiroplasma floricola 23-6 TaxID=1336749 RepID=A0A2K8SE33_9MOLU|nr:hypothetical protein [Spiroplasma floricola]AUB31682.1 hypothetical protein SFLOR_v1c06320 [Spiroplasma floricola 23-6]
MKLKFKNFFEQKLKMKIIIASISTSFLFLLSFLMITPGIGLESQKFINSIEKQIKQIMPKGMYVIDGQDIVFEEVMNSAIKSAYTTDALSTLNSYEDKDLVEKKEKYSQFAEKWFEKRWSEDIKNKKDVDLYDLGLDLINFDKAVATEFLSYAYVHSGIQWMFQSGGLKEAFSSSFYKQVKRDQTIIDQDVYDSWMKSKGPGLEGISIDKSLGTMIINNKTWFLNKQIENIKFGFNILGHSIFKNKDLNESNMTKKNVTKEELSYPFLTNTLEVFRAGVILFFIFLIVILPTFLTFLTLWIINWKKGANK